MKNTGWKGKIQGAWEDLVLTKSCVTRLGSGPAEPPTF
jgi:hypothetical protein